MSISIEKAVIHVLDRNSNEPLLNDYELTISDELYSFLEKHILKSLNDENSRKAKFKEGANIIKDTSNKILSDKDFFLEGSKDVARQLFKAMQTNTNISSADLIICVFMHEEETKVAILKMDYSTSFIHDIEMLEDKFKISIKKHDVSLPNINQKLQKCAFIGTNSFYEITILDNQINVDISDEPVAHFFLETFLGAELILDNKTCTKLFKKETENWIRVKEQEGAPLVNSLRDSVNKIIRNSDEINVDTFSSNVFNDHKELKEEYLSNIKQKGLTKDNFEIDKSWVEKKLNKIRLKTESNIEVILEYITYNDIDKFEITINEDGTKNILIKNFKNFIEK